MVTSVKSQEALKKGITRAREVLDNLLAEEIFVGEIDIDFDEDLPTRVKFNKNGLEMIELFENTPINYDYKIYLEKLYYGKGDDYIENIDPRAIMTTRLVKYVDKRGVNPASEYFTFYPPTKSIKSALLTVRKNRPRKLDIYNLYFDVPFWTVRFYYKDEV